MSNKNINQPNTDCEDKLTYVSTISELKNFEFYENNLTVLVLGYSTPQDGGGGYYYWDEMNTENDNGGTIIQSYLSLSGRWIAILENDFVDVRRFGTTGSNDAEKVQNAITACYGKIAIYEDIEIEDEIICENGLYIYALEDVNIHGTSLENNLFVVNGGSIIINGGKYSNMKAGIISGTGINLDTVTIISCHFYNCIYAISLFNNTGKNMSISNCTFNNLEVGLFCHFSRWNYISIDNITISNCLNKNLTVRNYPFDRNYIDGIWIKSDEGDSSVTIQNVTVNNVYQTINEGYTENHGVAVSLDIDSETNVIINSCNIRNVSVLNPTSATGAEGLMGRGKSVIIIGNILLNAGGYEGCIYAKGSKYHKIEANIIEINSEDIYYSEARGIISTGSNCDITNNKFINIPRAIYSRALYSKIDGNDFISISLACFTSSPYEAIHQVTYFLNNTIDKNSGLVFSILNGTNAVQGDYIISNNSINSKKFGVFKSSTNLILTNNYVNRNIDTTERNYIDITGPVNNIYIKNNEILSFANSNSPDDSIFLNCSAFTPNVTIENNTIRNGEIAIDMGGAIQNLNRFIVKGNCFLECLPISGTYSTITENVIYDNIGLLDNIKVSSVAGKTGNVILEITDIINLQAALNNKYNIPAGTSAEYIDGTGTLQELNTSVANVKFTISSSTSTAQISATNSLNNNLKRLQNQINLLVTQINTTS